MLPGDKAQYCPHIEGKAEQTSGSPMPGMDSLLALKAPLYSTIHPVLGHSVLADSKEQPKDYFSMVLCQVTSIWPRWVGRLLMILTIPADHSPGPESLV